MPHMSALMLTHQSNASKLSLLKPIQPHQQQQPHMFAHLNTIKDFKAAPLSNHHGVEDLAMPTQLGLNVSNKEDLMDVTVIQHSESDFNYYLTRYKNFSLLT